MWSGHHGFFPFGFLFPLLLIGFVCFRIFAFRRWGHGCNRWQGGELPAEELLRRRLVNGEIGEEEYLRLKEILKRR